MFKISLTISTNFEKTSNCDILCLLWHKLSNDYQQELLAIRGRCALTHNHLLKTSTTAQSRD